MSELKLRVAKGQEPKFACRKWTEFLAGLRLDDQVIKLALNPANSKDFSEWLNEAAPDKYKLLDGIVGHDWDKWREHIFPAAVFLSWKEKETAEEINTELVKLVRLAKGGFSGEDVAKFVAELKKCKFELLSVYDDEDGFAAEVDSWQKMSLPKIEKKEMKGKVAHKTSSRSRTSSRIKESVSKDKSLKIGKSGSVRNLRSRKRSSEKLCAAKERKGEHAKVPTKRTDAVKKCCVKHSRQGVESTKFSCETTQTYKGIMLSEGEWVKPKVRVCTVGHLDVGKTMLTAALTHVLNLQGLWPERSYSQVAHFSEYFGGRMNSNKILTIKPGMIEYETGQCRYIHYDCAGHEDYVKDMRSVVAKADLAILVVDDLGPMPQFREYVEMLRAALVTKIIVFLNKCDINPDEEIQDLAEMEVRGYLDSWGYKKVPVIRGSAYRAVLAETLMDRWCKPVAALVGVMDGIGITKR